MSRELTRPEKIARIIGETSALAIMATTFLGSMPENVGILRDFYPEILVSSYFILGAQQFYFNRKGLPSSYFMGIINDKGERKH